MAQEQLRINENIKSRELRVIGTQGENLGTLSVEEALKLARAARLDLIEISPNANPPVAKIMDLGKYKYEQSKKDKERKAKATSTETREIQVKLTTGENDLLMKAKRANEWLSDGNRVKIELFLKGRTKYLDKPFLEDRLSRILKLISTNFKIAEPMKDGPKGPYIVIERSK
jgi:translation initiation factor IF-3